MSSKKRVRFSEANERGAAKRRRLGGKQSDEFDPDVEEFQGPTSGVTTSSGAERMKKHTLDSDEEEEEDYEQVDAEEFEGQEDQTIDYEGETKITPFNMKDEMDEGHFDSEGTFIFKKDKEEIKDAWLDNIDWNMVKKNAGASWQKEDETLEGADDDEDEPIGDFKLKETSKQRLGRIDIYAEMLKLLLPGETVTRCLKRLAGTRNEVASRQERWQKKKKAIAVASETSGDTTSSSTGPEAESLGTNDLLTLTGLVDQLVANGEFEAYGYTYEKIQFESEQAVKASGPAVKPVDDLDMFAEESDLPKAAEPVVSEPTKNDKASAEEVVWYFKWLDDPIAPIFGPYKSEQMQQWVDESYFKDGVFVRRNETEQFYSSKRIDFELYT